MPSMIQESCLLKSKVCLVIGGGSLGPGWGIIFDYTQESLEQKRNERDRHFLELAKLKQNSKSPAMGGLV